jgi:hypothetical protein
MKNRLCGFLNDQMMILINIQFGMLLTRNHYMLVKYNITLDLKTILYFYRLFLLLNDIEEQ